MFYITHIQPTDIFDPAVHMRQDLDVFKVHIQHQEGKPPTVQLTVTKPADGEDNILIRGQRFFLACQHDDTVHLLFAGQVQSVPRPANEGLWVVDLMADSSTVDLKPVQEAYKYFPHWDPLFLPASQQDKVQGVIPQYARTKPMVCMVDPFKPATGMKNLHGNFYQDTLRVHQKDLPYGKIHGEIVVEWVQHYHGLTDISRMLVRELPEGMIGTLTADDFQKRWWEPQHVVKHTGYKIVQAHLTLGTPAMAGAGDVHPRQSASFTVNGQETTLPCHWFEPTLVVEWTYRQKRREILSFTLENPDPSAVGEHTMAWQLQDITADTTTPHWEVGAAYAIDTVV